MSNNAVIYQDRHISTAAEKPLDLTVFLTLEGSIVTLVDDSDLSIINQRIAENRREYERRYPLADAGLPLVDRIAADEATLRAVIRERAQRQFVTR